MDAQLVRACQDFEAVLLRPLFASLRPASLADPADEPDAGDAGGSSDIIAALFAEALATAFAQAGGMGIAGELAHGLQPPAR